MEDVMKVRILSALVALAIFIPLLCIGGYPFAFAIGVLSVVAYKEVLDLKKSHQDIPNLVKIFLPLRERTRAICPYLQVCFCWQIKTERWSSQGLRRR